MSTTTCFRGEIRKILCGYPLLSVAMHIMFCGKRRKISVPFVLYLEPRPYQELQCPLNDTL